jgi:hypothetical protein
MAGLDPAIHHSSKNLVRKRWTLGSSPGVTVIKEATATPLRLLRPRKRPKKTPKKNAQEKRSRKIPPFGGTFLLSLGLA